jgi:uncharacterized protein
VRLTPLAFLFALMVCHAAAAASFDCKKAATSVERAICSDAALSTLDERAVAAYAAASEALGIGEDDKDPMGELFLRSHTEWTAARNRCGAATNCLLAQYLRRVGVLGFKPDPQAASPLDPFVGSFGIGVEPVRDLVVMRGPGDVALVRVTVKSADWSCDFRGVGRLDKAGGLRVVRADYDGTQQGEHAVVLTPTRLGLALKQADPKDDVSARFCGAGGSLEQPFPRRS